VPEKAQAHRVGRHLHLRCGSLIGTTWVGLAARVIVCESKGPPIVAEDGVEDFAHWDDGAVNRTLRHHDGPAELVGGIAHEDENALSSRAGELGLGGSRHIGSAA